MNGVCREIGVVLCAVNAMIENAVEGIYGRGAGAEPDGEKQGKGGPGANEEQ